MDRETKELLGEKPEHPHKLAIWYDAAMRPAYRWYCFECRRFIEANGRT